jgi:hypothetical protein
MTGIMTPPVHSYHYLFEIDFWCTVCTGLQIVQDVVIQLIDTIVLCVLSL